MDRHIEEISSPGQGFILTSSSVGFREIEESLAAKVAGLAQGSALGQVFWVAHRRRKAVGEGSHMNYSGPICRQVHFFGLRRIDPQRFFAQNVLPRLGC